jgi:hypothetical protein
MAQQTDKAATKPSPERMQEKINENNCLCKGKNILTLHLDVTMDGFKQCSR